LTDNILYYF